MNKNQKLLTGMVEGEIIDAEFVNTQPKAQNDEPKLTIKRSKAYAKAILEDMDPQQALAFLRDQVLTKNLLINDQILAQLELLETASNWMEKTAIVGVIQSLTAVSTEITQSKLQLDKALGMHLLPHLPETAARPGSEIKEASISDFEAAYKKARAEAGQGPAPTSRA